MANQADIDRLKAAIDKCGDAIKEIGSAIVPMLAPVVTPPAPPPAPIPPPSSKVLWQDGVQGSADPNAWGFFSVVDTGDSLTRVANPAGSGFAMRHSIDPSTNGGRAQYSIASWTNSAFGAEAAKGRIWFGYQLYLPTMPQATPGFAWLSLMDLHSHEEGPNNWWATDPALMIATQAVGGANSPGRVRARDNSNLNFSNVSPMALPVGKWIDIQVDHTWSTTAAPTVWYIDGVEACRLVAPNKAPSHTRLEFMVKMYGADAGTSKWSPNPLVYYTRNLRVQDGLI